MHSQRVKRRVFGEVVFSHYNGGGKQLMGGLLGLTASEVSGVGRLFLGLQGGSTPWGKHGQTRPADLWLRHEEEEGRGGSWRPHHLL